jgi:TIR domain
MATVFISHSSRDKNFTEELASELRKYGHQPVGDLGSLTVSPDWDAELLNALTESDVVVFLFTNNATGSENILGEVGSAKTLYSLVKKPHLIPVVFPGGTLPEPLSRVWAQVLPTVPTAAELGARINALIANLPTNSTTPLGNVFAPEKITLPWLREHVPVSYWIVLAGVLVSLVIGTFTFGVKAGQIPGVARFLSGKEPSSPAAMEAPKTGDAKTDGQQSPAVTGSGNDIQYNQPAPQKEKPKTSK